MKIKNKKRLFSTIITMLCAANICMAGVGAAAETIFAGDANNDGKVNVRDCATIARLLAEARTNELPLWADFDGDGKISVRDAANLSKGISQKTFVETPYVPVVTEPVIDESLCATYREFAKNYPKDDFNVLPGSDSQFYFTLYDITKDGVPEFIAYTNGKMAFYSWNETDGVYQIGEAIWVPRNPSPGYYWDNGEFGVTGNSGSMSLCSVIKIDGDTCACEEGEPSRVNMYFVGVKSASLDNEESIDEYFDSLKK